MRGLAFPIKKPTMNVLDADYVFEEMKWLW